MVSPVVVLYLCYSNTSRSSGIYDDDSIHTRNIFMNHLIKGNGSVVFFPKIFAKPERGGHPKGTPENVLGFNNKRLQHTDWAFWIRLGQAIAKSGVRFRVRFGLQNGTLRVLTKRHLVPHSF
jgi:hypothetical protein